MVDLGDDELLELIEAASFLDINPLIEIACAQIAWSIDQLPLEETRKKYNPNYMKEDEEILAALKAERRWHEEQHEMELEVVELRQAKFWDSRHRHQILKDMFKNFKIDSNS